MIARAKPAPDDGPDPELVTPKRIAAELLAIARRASQLRIRARGLTLYFGPPKPIEDERQGEPTAHGRLAQLFCGLGTVSDLATDLATAVRVGQVALDERYLDLSCRPERPLLDAIEGRPLARAAEAIAPAVAARGDTAPGFDEASSAPVEIGAGDPIRVPTDHPAAGEARQAARRRKAAKGGVS